MGQHGLQLTTRWFEECARADAERRRREGLPDAPEGTSENPSCRIVTLANAITFGRLILTLVFLALFATGGSRLIAVVCYAVAAITDFLDGQIARRTQTVTWLGKIMDPFMDRVLLFTGVLGLVIAGDLPVWVAIFVILRDVYLWSASAWLQKFSRRPIDVLYIGKVTTAFLMFGFSDLLVGWPIIAGLGVTSATWLPGLNQQPAAIGILLVYIGVVLSAITCALYTQKGIQLVRSATRRGEHQ